ncbi:MAG: hypothetical protein EAZ24_16890 [Burkholderiales bacterium]|nr:MAG: hypothetical protein EAZ24_16890 [Burkholderiales bacterium]
MLPFTNEKSLETLKKASLLFGKCALAFLTSVPRARRARFPLSIAYYSDEQLRSVSAELEWLFSNGFLDSPSRDPFPSGFEMEDFDLDRPVWVIRTSDGATTYYQSHKDAFGDSVQKFPNEALPPTKSPTEVLQITKNPLKVVPLILTDETFHDESSNESTHSSSPVLNVLLSNVPQPSAETPWQALLDWRHDEEAQIKFRRLKHWMNSVSNRKDLNADHLKDEVAHLLDEYQRYMKLQDAKFSSSGVRAIVTTSAEVVESIVKLKFKELADMPFKINAARIALKEAEQKAPGRELAYIVDAQKKFNA